MFPRRNVSRWKFSNFSAPAGAAVASFADRVPIRYANAAIAMATRTATTGRTRRLRSSDLAIEGDDWEPEVAESDSRSKARSLADWNRASGCFSRQCRTIRSRPGWTFGFDALSSGGSSFRIAFIVSTEESR